MPRGRTFGGGNMKKMSMVYLGNVLRRRNGESFALLGKGYAAAEEALAYAAAEYLHGYGVPCRDVGQNGIVAG